MLKNLGCFGLTLIGVLSLIQGFLALLAPKRCIEVFQTWCRYLNWEVSPIRWDKELRNTRILGGLLTLLGILLFLVLCQSKAS